MTLISPADAAVEESGWQPRAIFRGLLIVLILLTLFVPHMVFRAVGVRSPMPKIFLKGVCWAVGLDVYAHGDRRTHNVLYVGNHVSWMDIIALGGATGCAFVSKAEVEQWPVIGWLADQIGTVYVKREDRRAVMGQAMELREAVAKGDPVTLFPEGTTNDGITVKPFRASLLASMVNPPGDAKVQPVVLDYGKDAADIAWTEDDLGPNLKRVLARDGKMTIHLYFLEPLADELTHDRKVMASAARDAIVYAMAETSNMASGRVRYRL